MEKADLAPELKAVLQLLFSGAQKIVAFTIAPGREKIEKIEVDKDSLVSLKDWHEFKSLCVPVPVCLICEMWHTCRGRC